MHSNHLQDMQHYSISLSRASLHLRISEEENQIAEGVLSSSSTPYHRTLFSDHALMKRINLQLAVVMLSSSSTSHCILRCINYALMNSVRLAMLRTCVSKAGEQPLVMVIGASYE